MAPTLTPGKTYEIAYRATLYAKKPTVRVGRVALALPEGRPTTTYILRGDRGGKFCVTPTEIITATEVA